MDICFDVNMELQDLDNDILTNKKFDEFKLVSYWNQVNCDGIYASMIRQTYGSNTSLLFTTRERRPYGRGHYDQLVFSFNSIAHMFCRQAYHIPSIKSCFIIYTA